MNCAWFWDQECARLSKALDLKESVKTPWRDLNPSPLWSRVSLEVVCESGLCCCSSDRRTPWLLVGVVTSRLAHVKGEAGVYL